MAFDFIEEDHAAHNVASSSPEPAIPGGLNLSNTLILMACSGKKKPLAPGAVMSLIDLYDGPTWQSLRTHLNGRRAHVVVLSGRYGFTNAYSWLPTYEAKLSSQKADHLISRGLYERQDRFGELRDVLDVTPLSELIRPGTCARPTPENGWHGVIVCGGGEYRRVFEHMIQGMRECNAIRAGAPILMTRGGIGEQRSQLGRWVSSLAANSHA